MAWDDEMVTVLRALLQDNEATPKYTDDRLAEMILVTALGIRFEVKFPTAYVVSVENGTLKPDPTSTATRDDAFINLTCLKAASRLVDAELREMTRQGITIKDGDNTISLQRSPAALIQMQKTYKQAYEDALFDWKTGGSDGAGANFGHLIIGPYNANDYGVYYRRADHRSGGLF